MDFEKDVIQLTAYTLPEVLTSGGGGGRGKLLGKGAFKNYADY